MPRSLSYQLKVPASLQGQRLDKALTTLLSAEAGALSRARLQALLAQGHVQLSGKPVTDASRKAKTGETHPFSSRSPFLTDLPFSRHLGVGSSPLRYKRE